MFACCVESVICMLSGNVKLQKIVRTEHVISSIEAVLKKKITRHEIQKMTEMLQLVSHNETIFSS